jgi:cation:H+ antiporter
MVFGADWLVKGCSRLARRIGISEFIVSVVIIGIGTTAPEIIVSILSSAKGYGSLAISNAIGSNIFLILGIFAIGVLLHPITIDYHKRKLELYFVFLAATAMMWTVIDGTISRIDGMVLFSIFLAYIIAYRIKNINTLKKNKPEYIHIKKILIPLIAGILGLYFGSKYFMSALETIALNYSLNERIMGILIVAPGTSVPELLVTIIASIRKHSGIILGNILGSNIANISLAVAGASFMSPLTVSKYTLSLDIWVMVGATALLCWQLSHFKKISKLTGIIYLSLLGIYIYFI